MYLMLVFYCEAYTQITSTEVQAPGSVITHYNSARNKSAQMLRESLRKE
jgi:hypothetical protein